MKYKFIIFAILIINHSIFSQNSVKRDTILVTNICFNGICIGDNVEKLNSILPRPDSVFTNEVSMDENNPQNLTKFKYYIFGNKKEGSFLQVVELKTVNTNSKSKDKVYILNAFRDKTIYFGKVKKLIMGSDMEKIKTVFPNSYKYSTAYQIASHNAIVARYKNEILKYEILKRDKRYKEDKIFRDKIDNELAKKIKNAPVSLQINDISIDVIIQNNSFNFYTRLSFVYKAGSLEQILMMKDY